MTHLEVKCQSPNLQVSPGVLLTCFNWGQFGAEMASSGAETATIEMLTQSVLVLIVSDSNKMIHCFYIRVRLYNLS